MADLITLDDVRLTGLTPDAGQQENFVKLLISGISTGAENFCQRRFIKGDHVETFDGDRTETLIVNVPPVNSIDSIVEDDLTLDATWYVYYANGIIKRKESGVWAKGIQNIVVTYNGGVEITALPMDLKLALLEWLRFAWKRFDSERIGVQQISYGDQNVTYVMASMPNPVKDVLTKYRRLPIG